MNESKGSTQTDIRNTEKWGKISALCPKISIFYPLINVTHHPFLEEWSNLFIVFLKSVWFFNSANKVDSLYYLKGWKVG